MIYRKEWYNGNSSWENWEYVCGGIYSGNRFCTSLGELGECWWDWGLTIFNEIMNEPSTLGIVSIQPCNGEKNTGMDCRWTQNYLDELYDLTVTLLELWLGFRGIIPSCKFQLCSSHRIFWFSQILLDRDIWYTYIYIFTYNQPSKHGVPTKNFMGR